jgi:transaldolase
VPEADDLKGKIGIASAKMAYQRFQETFAGKRWERLAEKGAKLQRVLYGSTSTKNPDYPDTLYIDNLIGPDTINTVPPSTLEAFLDHGTVSATLPSDLAEAELQLNTLEELGIHLGDVSNQLLREGVDKFTKSYETLIARLAEKKAESVTARSGNIGSEQV